MIPLRVDFYLNGRRMADVRNGPSASELLNRREVTRDGGEPAVLPAWDPMGSLAAESKL